MEDFEIKKKFMFTTFKELEDSMEKYQKIRNKPKLTLTGGSKIHPEGNPIIWNSFKLICVGYGEHKSRGAGIRKPKESKKCGCPFYIKFNSPSTRNYLYVEDFHLNHNEACEGKNYLNPPNGN